MDFTRLAGQFGNLAGNLLFRGRPEIDAAYKQFDREQYEPQTKVQDLIDLQDLDFGGLLVEGLFRKAKKKKDEVTLPARPGESETNPYETDSCAECRARQAKSGMMNITDPCRGVCGG